LCWQNRAWGGVQGLDVTVEGLGLKVRGLGFGIKG
jgi:hypothetical protein